MKKRFLIITICLIGITSCICNIKYQLRIENLIKEKENLISEIQEKDQLIEDYQDGISQIEFVDECYIGEYYE